MKDLEIETMRLVQHYDRIASRYRELYEGGSRLTRFYRSRQAAVLGLADRFTNGAVLEIGCAAGLLVDFFLSLGVSYTGVDISPGMIGACRERYSCEARAAFVIGNATDLDFPDDTFDAVVSLGVIEYVRDENSAVAEMARVARPGGTVVVSGITRWSPGNVWKHVVDRQIRQKKPAGILQEFHSVSDLRATFERQSLSVDEIVYFDFPFRANDETKSSADSVRGSWLRLMGNGFLIVASVPKVETERPAYRAASLRSRA